MVVEQVVASAPLAVWGSNTVLRMGFCGCRKWKIANGIPCRCGISRKVMGREECCRKDVFGVCVLVVFEVAQVVIMYAFVMFDFV